MNVSFTINGSHYKEIPITRCLLSKRFALIYKHMHRYDWKIISVYISKTCAFINLHTVFRFLTNRSTKNNENKQEIEIKVKNEKEKKNPNLDNNRKKNITSMTVFVVQLVIQSLRFNNT